MSRFDNLSAEELEQIKRFIKETDIDTIDDEMPALVETHWGSWEKLPPPRKGARPRPTPLGRG